MKMPSSTRLLSRGSRVQIAAGAPQIASVSADFRRLRYGQVPGNTGRKVTAVTFALLLLALSASAQERHAFKLPLTLLAAAGAADVSTTMSMARHNAVYAPGTHTENNPLIAWMEPKIGTGPMLAISGAVELGAFWLACHHLCDSHPKLMKYAFMAGAAAHGMATAGNVLSQMDDAAYRRRLGIR